MDHLVSLRNLGIILLLLTGTAFPQIINPGGGPGGTPGGSDTFVQFNNAGAFGGDSGFTYGGASGTGQLFLNNTVATPGATMNIGTPLGNPANTGGLMLTGTATIASEIEIHNPFSVGMKIYTHTDAAHAFRGPTIVGFRSEGTQASPTAVANADNLLYVQAQGYNGSAYAVGGTFECFANQTWTTAHQGTYCQIFSTPINTNSPVASLTIGNQNGSISTSGVGIKNQNPAAEFDVQTSSGGRIAFGTPNSGITDADLLNNQISFYTNQTTNQLLGRIKFNDASLHTITLPIDIPSGGSQSISGCTLSAASGTATAGTFTSGTTGTCTITAVLPTTPNGWSCFASDLTTVADNLHQTGTPSATGATFGGTTASGDVVTWGCIGY